MADKGYGQFCPVAMAAEILGTRWTLVLLRELLAGSTRFNELRRGVPRMSPALLSQRLKDLEAAGILQRAPAPGQPGVQEYTLTEAGRDLWPVIEAVGTWGQRWVETEVSLRNLDPGLLMWDMHRSLDRHHLPERRSVIQFSYPELPKNQRHWWLIVEPGDGVDLCWMDPGYDVNLYVSADLRAMTEIWLGRSTVERAKMEGRLRLVGERDLAGAMQSWLGLSAFAQVEKRLP